MGHRSEHDSYEIVIVSIEQKTQIVGRDVQVYVSHKIDVVKVDF